MAQLCMGALRLRVISPKVMEDYSSILAMARSKRHVSASRCAICALRLYRSRISIIFCLLCIRSTSILMFYGSPDCDRVHTLIYDSCIKLKYWFGNNTVPNNVAVTTSTPHASPSCKDPLGGRASANFCHVQACDSASNPQQQSKHSNLALDHAEIGRPLP